MYSQERTCDRTVKIVVSAELPLSIVDNEHFTIFVKEYLQRRYEGVSKNTLHFDTIGYFYRIKNQLISNLNKCGGVIYLTPDLWEGINKKSLINSNYTLHKPTLIYAKKKNTFKIIDYPYNANNIYNYIRQIIREYKYENKIHSFIFGKASDNKSAIDKLWRILNPDFGGFLFHVRLYLSQF